VQRRYSSIIVLLPKTRFLLRGRWRGCLPLAVDQGFKPQNLSISGDSAGGGLAMAILVSARDQGLPMPLCCAH
jgi:hypothetical protein